MATVEIVIPVLNEERALPGCVRTLHDFLGSAFPLAWQITVVDNGSTDATWEVATGLAAAFPEVRARRIDVRGRGAALRAAWSGSTADIVAYMDVDLSTGLDALLPLVAPLVSGHADVVVGSRLAHGARVTRGVRREMVSRCYNRLLRAGFRTGFRDAQCGFKAARTDLVRPLLEKVADDRWFFDTELLLLAEYNGLRVREVPVDWIEDVDTRVDVVRTALDDLRGVARVARSMAAGRATVELPARPEPSPAHPDAVLAKPRAELLVKLVSFGMIGVVSSVLHALIYLLLRDGLEPVGANFVALLVTAVANTEANRRWTFNRAGGPRAGVHTRAGLLFAINYAFTTGVVTLLHVVAPDVHRVTETATLVAAFLMITLLRFLALDRWVFPARRPAA
ncbi:glycosyltransferase [Actinomadura flavalba]|uniref:glycosyltransferase n=1 Tax=Actinomadura flavalba TaxID=1120938 RepID=UPI000368D55A|nr:glycosyltransferase [Actinomadura flavalba]